MRPGAAAVVLAVALAVAVGGCGSGAGSPGRSRTGAGAVALHGRAVVLVTGAGRGAPAARGVRALVRGARAEATRLGDRLSVRGHPGLTAGEQIGIVDDVITAKPGAVLIAPVDDDALAAPIASLRQAGIVVVRLPAGRGPADASPGTDAAVGAAAVRRAVGSVRASAR